MNDLFKSYLKGLGFKHVLVIPFAFILTLIFLFTLELLWVRGVITRGIELEKLLVNPKDERTKLSEKIYKEMNSSPKRKIYFLGGSSTLAALKNDKLLSDEIKLVCDLDIEASILGMSSMNYGHFSAIVENLPPEPALIVVGLTHNAFIHRSYQNLSQLKTGLRIQSYEYYKKIVLERGDWSKLHWFTQLPSILTYINDYSRTRLKSGLTLNQDFDETSRPYEDVSVEEMKKLLHEWRDLYLNVFEEYSKDNYNYAKIFLEISKKYNKKVILMTLPEAMEISKEILNPFYLKHDELSDRLSKEYSHVMNKNFREKKLYKIENFSDHVHFNDKGAVNFQADMVRWLSNEIKSFYQ